MTAAGFVFMVGIIHHLNIAAARRVIRQKSRKEKLVVIGMRGIKEYIRPFKRLFPFLNEIG